MKICIISDSHDNRPLLKAAVRDACALGAEVVLHCGDVVAPSTLEALAPFKIPVHVIHGNNTGDLYMMGRVSAQVSNQTTYYGQDAGLKLGGRRVFLVHYPHYAEAMATTGDAVLKVTHSGGKPILMFDRDKFPHLPDGATEFIANGDLPSVTLPWPRCRCLRTTTVWQS